MWRSYRALGCNPKAGGGEAKATQGNTKACKGRLPTKNPPPGSRDQQYSSMIWMIENKIWCQAHNPNFGYNVHTCPTGPNWNAWGNFTQKSWLREWMGVLVWAAGARAWSQTITQKACRPANAKVHWPSWASTTKSASVLHICLGIFVFIFKNHVTNKDLDSFCLLLSKS